MAGRLQISIVIPMLNEEANVGKLFARLFPVMEALGEPYEVIAIDDGSTDQTAKYLADAQERHAQLVVVTLGKN